MNLDSIFAEFYDAADSQEVTFDALLRLAQQVGFSNANLNVIQVNDDGRQSSLEWHTSYCTKWTAAMNALPTLTRVSDPILAHLGARSDPLIWDERTYSDRTLYEQFVEHGIGSGVAAALPLPSPGQRLFLGFSGPQTSVAETRYLGSQVAALMLGASLAASAFSTPPAERREPCPLSPRELEVLRWVRDGKSTWEISVILGISAGTVSNHIRNISEKLSVSTRVQAVVCATREKWL